MSLTLVGAEDVSETVQPTEETMPREELKEEMESEFQVNNGLKVVLEDVYDLTTGGMEMHGYKRHIFAHPTENYDIAYFIKGRDVIMVDYHDTNTVKIEVLRRKDAEVVIDTIKSAS